MELIDSHCHLYLPEFAGTLGDFMQRAENEGVKRFYLPAIDDEHRPALLSLAERYPSSCYAMEGLHPCSVKADYQQALKAVEDSLASQRFVAVGEIGLDFYWDKTFSAQQYEAFHRQIEWAMHYQLPIVIHSRSSITESIEVVRQHQNGSLRGIFHCFTEDAAAARAIVDLGFMLGIGGVLTYKNSKLPEAIQDIGLKHLVLETDAPYLPPVPFRGKRNEPAYIRYTATRLAEIKGLSLEEVAATTTANALEIFGK